jgi:GntR family transcriptional repressor for pyruvate dehydrogenase complex
VAGDQNGAIRNLLSTARRSEEDSVRELLEFRRFLECEISALAAQRRTEADLERLQQALQNTQRAMASGQNILEPDLAFHSALADAAHNFVLKRVYRSTSDLLRYVRTKTMHVAATDVKAIRFHTAIFDAVREQHPQEARQHMSEHLDDFAATVAEVFSTRQ